MNNNWNGKGMPPLNTELDTPRIIGDDGVDEWWCKATHKVVAHHIDGQRFFTENMSSGKHIGIYTADVMDPQYRPVRDEKEEAKQKAIDGMTGLAIAHFGDIQEGMISFCRLLCDSGYTKDGVKQLPKDWYHNYHNYADTSLSIREWLIENGYCIGITN
jgi:hypothetical protein